MKNAWLIRNHDDVIWKDDPMPLWAESYWLNDERPSSDHVKVKVTGRFRSKYGWQNGCAHLWVHSSKLPNLRHSIPGWSKVEVKRCA